MMLAQSSPVTIPSAESWTLKDSSGQPYIVQIGFPRVWTSQESKKEHDLRVPILYLTDGNALFFSALEALHRHIAVASVPAGLIVAIGYPISSDSDFLFSSRRRRDLTPPSKGCAPEEGGADEFADFIQHRVRPFVHGRLHEIRSALPGKEALYGHSFGGLFTLHTLFQNPGAFDYFIASSPSIWWNDRFLLQEEEEFRRHGQQLTSKPSLMMFVGGEEQDPPRKRGESDDEYEERRKRHLERTMVDDSLEMHERLQASGRLQRLSFHVYDGEDHGTVIACSLSRGLTTFFTDWPYEV